MGDDEDHVDDMLDMEHDYQLQAPNKSSRLDISPPVVVYSLYKA